MLNTKTRLFCFLKKVAGAPLKSQLWLLAPANQKISSRTASGAALKTAAPAPQHWLQLPVQFYVAKYGVSWSRNKRKRLSRK